MDGGEFIDTSDEMKRVTHGNTSAAEFEWNPAD